MDIICPYCGAELEADGVSPGDEVACPSCGVGFVAATVRARPSARPPALRARPARTWGQRLHSCLLWAVALLIVPPMLSCIWYATREPEPGARPSPPTTTRPRPAATTTSTTRARPRPVPTTTSTTRWTPPPSWTLRTRRDEMTDERIVTISARGETVEVDGLPARPELTIRRRGREIEAIYTPGGALHYYHDANAVEMRIDDGCLVTTTWTPSTTGESLFYSGDVAAMAAPAGWARAAPAVAEHARAYRHAEHPARRVRGGMGRAHGA